MKAIIILDHWNDFSDEYKQKFADKEGITYDKDLGYLYYVLDIPYLPSVGDYVSTRYGELKVDHVVYDLEPQYEDFKSNPKNNFYSISRIHLIEA